MLQENNFPEDLYKYDTENYKRYLQGYAEDLRTSYNRPLRSFTEKINLKKNIIITGSSWSLNAAKIAGEYLAGKVNITFVEGYSETHKITKDDALIAISHSGNSEEARTWLKIARRHDAQTLIITNGGKLEEDSFDTPTIDLTKNIPSKCSTFTIIGTLIRLFEDAGLIDNQTQEIQETVDYLRQQNATNLAMNLSKKLYGVIPLIYSTNTIKNSARKFKKLINSNAKSTAFYNVIPDAEYYEAESFQTKNATFHAIIITTSQDTSRVKKRANIYKETIQNQGISVTELNIKGKGLLKIATTIIIGEYTSYYLALRYKKDPLRNDVTEKIKKDMGLFI